MRFEIMQRILTEVKDRDKYLALELAAHFIENIMNITSDKVKTIREILELTEAHFEKDLYGQLKKLINLYELSSLADDVYDITRQLVNRNSTSMDSQQLNKLSQLYTLLKQFVCPQDQP